MPRFKLLSFGLPTFKLNHTECKTAPTVHANVYFKRIVLGQDKVSLCKLLLFNILYTEFGRHGMHLQFLQQVNFCLGVSVVIYFDAVGICIQVCCPILFLKHEKHVYVLKSFADFVIYGSSIPRFTSYIIRPIFHPCSIFQARIWRHCQSNCLEPSASYTV